MGATFSNSTTTGLLSANWQQTVAVHSSTQRGMYGVVLEC